MLSRSEQRTTGKEKWTEDCPKSSTRRSCSRLWFVLSRMLRARSDKIQESKTKKDHITSTGIIPTSRTHSWQSFILLYLLMMTCNKLKEEGEENSNASNQWVLAKENTHTRIIFMVTWRCGQCEMMWIAWHGVALFQQISRTFEDSFLNVRRRDVHVSI